MKRACFVVGFLAFLGMLAQGAAPLPRRPQPDPDELRLAGASVSVKPARLLKFLAAKCGEDADLDRIPALVKQMGDDAFASREDASKRLTALGVLALPGLRTGLTNDDPEIVRRSRSCIQAISKALRTDVLGAAVRLIASQNADGAAATLLRFLPYADEIETQEEVWFALDALAASQKRLDPAFEKTQGDRLALRRAAAAYILARRGNAAQKQLAKASLKDKGPHVRLRAAQGFLGRDDSSGVGVLIELLKAAEIEVALQAEELLHWAAGGRGPEATVGAGTDEARKQCHKAWAGWWRARGEKVDFAFARRWHQRPGLFLVFDENGPRWKAIPHMLWLCGCDGRPRWSLTGLGTVTDAQWLPGGRLLLAQAQEQRDPKKKENMHNYGLRWRTGVAERALDGKVMWKYQIPESVPYRCQRLSDETTVVSSFSHLRELDWLGRQTVEYQLNRWGRPFRDHRLYQGQRTLRGTIFAFGEVSENKWALAEIDPTTAQVKLAIPLGDGRGGSNHGLRLTARPNYCKGVDLVKGAGIGFAAAFPAVVLQG